MKRGFLWTLLTPTVVALGIFFYVRFFPTATNDESTSTTPSEADIQSDPSRVIRYSLEAYGISKRTERIESMKLENEIVMYGEDEAEVNGHSAEYYRLPDKVRVDYRFGPQGITYIYDGLRAWMYKGDRRSEAPDYLAEGLRRSIKHLPNVLLPTALDERSILGAVVLDSLGGREMITISLTDREEDQSRLWFDPVTFLLARIDYTLYTSQGANSMSIVLGNYRDFNGIRIASSVAFFYNDQLAQETWIKNVTFNPSIPDSLFEPPVGGE